LPASTLAIVVATQPLMPETITPCFNSQILAIQKGEKTPTAKAAAQPKATTQLNAPTRASHSRLESGKSRPIRPI
jgi:hypothetical protein